MDFAVFLERDMAAKWKGGNFKPEVVLNKISEIRTVDEHGKVSFGGQIRRILPTLDSMIDFPSAASNLNTPGIIWHAVDSIKGEITEKSVLAAINSELDKNFKKRIECFKILSSISIPKSTAIAPLKIEGIELRFYKSDYPKMFRSSRALAIQKNRVPARENNENYLKLIATVKARDYGEAFLSANRAIDIYRALWCYAFNHSMYFLSAAWKPVNQVRLGTFHTVHAADGTAFTNSVWFEPHLEPAEVLPHTANLTKPVAHLQKGLNKNKYAKDLKVALLLFVRALDEANPTTALIRLWSAMERLACPQKADYDLLVKRCAALYIDFEFATQELEHLRLYRNNYVHNGIESQDAKSYCGQLLDHFRELLRFHLSNNFSSLNEANDFLDLPTNIKKLETIKKNAGRALALRSKH